MNCAVQNGSQRYIAMNSSIGDIYIHKTSDSRLPHPKQETPDEGIPDPGGGGVVIGETVLFTNSKAGRLSI